MSSYIEAGVPVVEVAKATKRTVAEVVDECQSLGVFVGRNWAGQPSVEERDAAKLVDGTERAAQEQAAAWRRHQALSEDWERQRREVQRAAALDAYRSASARGEGDPQANAAAREAGREAAEAFEQRHRAPEWMGQPTAPSWFQRAASKISEAVR